MLQDSRGGAACTQTSSECWVPHGTCGPLALQQQAVTGVTAFLPCCPVTAPLHKSSLFLRPSPAVLCWAGALSSGQACTCQPSLFKQQSNKILCRMHSPTSALVFNLMRSHNSSFQGEGGTVTAVAPISVGSQDASHARCQRVGLEVQGLTNGHSFRGEQSSLQSGL